MNNRASASGAHYAADDFMAEPDQSQDDFRSIAPPEQPWSFVEDPLPEPLAEMSESAAADTSRARILVNHLPKFYIFHLLVACGLFITVWHANRERDTLQRDLRSEIGARKQAQLAVRDMQLELAEVRRELSTLRDPHAPQLARKREAKAHTILAARAACTTPRSILREKSL